VICWWLNSNIEDCFICCAFPEDDVQTEAVNEVAVAPKGMLTPFMVNDIK
jgi:hypothetical protein